MNRKPVLVVALAATFVTPVSAVYAKSDASMKPESSRLIAQEDKKDKKKSDSQLISQEDKKDKKKSESQLISQEDKKDKKKKSESDLI